MAIGAIRAKLFIQFFQNKTSDFGKIKKVVCSESLFEQITFLLRNLSLNSKNNYNKLFCYNCSNCHFAPKFQFAEESPSIGYCYDIKNEKKIQDS